MNQTDETLEPLSDQAHGLGARLDSRELKRRFWHMLPGLLPMLLWAVDHRDPLSPTLRIIMVAIIAVLGAAIFVYFKQIERVDQKSDRVGAVFGYAASVLATLFLFPAHAELGLTVLAVLAFGDGSATLGGKLIGGPKLPWNHGKSWSGLCCFVIAGVPLASLVYWGETNFNGEARGPVATVGAACICGVAAVIPAAVVESLRSGINDNIRVGVTAAVSVAVAHGLYVGF